MVVTLRGKIVLLTSLLVLAASIYLAANPATRIKLFKSYYVKYARIVKGDFKRRFNDQELLFAINHARQQPWVLEQIAQDLAPFQGGITTEQINYWFKQFQHEYNQLAKFTIKDSVVSVDVAPELLDKRSYKTVHEIVTMLAQKKLIPDCQFIVALNDYLAHIPDPNMPPAAIFSFAKHNQIPVEQDTILIPDWMNVRYWDILKGRIEYANKTFPWDKKPNIIHWRGGQADSMQHRSRLVQLNSKLKFLDVGMTEGAKPANFVDPEFSVQYKYQISLDGARCTWERMIWQMHSNTVLIKPNSPQVQWFHRGLVPFENYVPIKDVDELNIIAAYNWLQSNDSAARKISANANKFARDNFKTQDMFAYYAVLLQEYAKLQR